LSFDISDILKGWDHEPSSIKARWVMGKDGRMKVQLRLDLGLFQMEAEGRPDGSSPRGYPSLLQYYQSMLKTSSKTEALHLGMEACAELQQEALQYYYRYLAFYSLRNHPGVIVDTRHNLDIINLATEYAENEEMAWQFVQFYPYVRMMNARSMAEKMLEEKNHQKAVTELQAALDDINEFWSHYGEGGTIGGNEVEVLSDLLRQVTKQKPRSREDEIEDQLNRAIATENYEKAAKLRDELKNLKTPSSTD